MKWETSKNKSLPNAGQTHQDKYRKSTYPDYPSGWYPLCWSHEVKRGEVIQRNALGKFYAIFRGENNGEIGILDAFCPHLGSNLTVGGKVCGDTLQCPFHRWRFDQHGKCTEIPYLTTKNKRIPSSAPMSLPSLALRPTWQMHRNPIFNHQKQANPLYAHTTCYPCVEYHDMVCVYYSNTNKQPTPSSPIIPAYHLPVQHDLLDGSNYAYVGSLDYGVVNMHIQEFAENAADWMHFEPIHGKMMFPFTQIQVPFIDRWLTIHHDPATHIGGGGAHSKDSKAIQENKYGPDNKHFLYFINRPYLKWNNKLIANSDADANITFCGPAGVCIFRFCIPKLDPTAYIVLFHTHLPEDEMNLRVRFHWYASHKLPRLLVWYVVGNWISQWTNDIAIWENKILLNKPCLVKGDGPIFKVRRWFRQFYPDREDKKKQEEMKEKVVIQTDIEVDVEKEKKEEV
eukprot:CAMPEP_0197073800 /NCGR_PEP_ID=MMETSP1384-20130603/210790_1 /TAXON_ID=29189 /ORGANISM="Ammonia sp." /LENGTH=454 /DNA_ID=CAMNT_0042512641 /DNA_START=206 /DNA_END=1568 /DNA_ORIENTATION=-